MRKLELYVIDMWHYFKGCKNMKNKHKSTSCETCDVIFTSRTKLFQHLNLNKHAQLGVSPGGYWSKYDHVEDEEYTVNFVRWLLTPITVTAKETCFDHRLSSAAASNVGPKYSFSKLTKCSYGEFSMQSVPMHVLSAKLDCGISVYSLIVARCLLTKHNTPSRSYLIGLCKDAHKHVDILGIYTLYIYLFIFVFIYNMLVSHMSPSLSL